MKKLWAGYIKIIIVGLPTLVVALTVIFVVRINLNTDKKVVDESNIQTEDIMKGNSTENIVSYGLVAYNDEFAFYSNLKDDGKLYKMNINTLETTKLCEDKVKYLNMYNNYIYYVKDEEVTNDNYALEIKRIKTDGSENEVILGKEAKCYGLMQIVDDVLYYDCDLISGDIGFNDTVAINSLNLKTSEVATVSRVNYWGWIIRKDSDGNLNIAKPTWYSLGFQKDLFDENSGSNNSIRGISLKGFTDDKIYYYGSGILDPNINNVIISSNTTNLQDGNNEVIYSGEDVPCILGSEYLYLAEGGNICRVNLNTKKKEVVKSQCINDGELKESSRFKKNCEDFLFEVNGYLAYFNKDLNLVIDKNININGDSQLNGVDESKIEENNNEIDNKENSNITKSIDKEEVLVSENPQEYKAVIKGKANDGSILWTFESKISQMTQYGLSSDIFENNDKIFFTVVGTLYCLDKENGKLLWTVDNLGGGNNVAFISENTLAITSSLGNDLEIIKFNNNEVEECKIIKFDELAWANKIEKFDNYLKVYFGMCSDVNKVSDFVKILGTQQPIECIAYFEFDGNLLDYRTIEGYGDNIESSAGDSEDTVITAVYSEPTSYYFYSNERFGYSIEYPSFLNYNGEENQGADALFSTNDNSVYLKTYAYNNDYGYTIENLHNDDMNTKSYIKYSYLGERSYIIAWREGNEDFYRCIVAENGSINGFDFKYQIKDSDYFYNVVDYVYNSFNVGNLKVSH